MIFRTSLKHIFLDLKVAAAILALRYLLPTTSRKLLDAHQYLLDITSKPVSELEFAERRQPFIQFFGSSFGDFDKIVVFADTIAVGSYENIHQALYAVFCLYYSLNIEYASSVFSALQFLQIKCLHIQDKPRLGVLHFLKLLEQQ